MAASQKPAATTSPAPAKAAATKAVTVHTLANLRSTGEKITMLTLSLIHI